MTYKHTNPKFDPVLQDYCKLEPCATASIRQGPCQLNLTLSSVSVPNALLQPVRFCNLHHEAVYLRLLIANLSLALIPVLVDLFYNYGE